MASAECGAPCLRCAAVKISSSRERLADRCRRSDRPIRNGVLVPLYFRNIMPSDSSPGDRYH